jgi:NAD(P)-dependent dehydrogenase (short-subunit alcohol dehydrogenase family)
MSELRGKICLVTGSSSGLGKGTTELLAAKGASIIMVSRQNSRGESAYNEIRKIAREKVVWLPADLSSMNSVRSLYDKIDSKFDKINFLFNCAGIINLSRKTTVDGYEEMFETNYLSHFLLTNLLYGKLRNGSPSRVITVSGRGHKSRLTEGIRRGTIDFDDLQGSENFSFPQAAKQAVLAKIMFTYELARQWKNAGIEACTVCPGLTRTNLVSNHPSGVRLYMATRYLIQKPQSPQEGASHLIALAERTDDINGKYFEGSRRRLVEARSSDESYETRISERLWNESELLTGQSFNYK